MMNWIYHRRVVTIEMRAVNLPAPALTVRFPGVSMSNPEAGSVGKRDYGQEKCDGFSPLEGKE